jgi:hypothetical protein
VSIGLPQKILEEVLVDPGCLGVCTVSEAECDIPACARKQPHVATRKNEKTGFF